VEKSLHHSCASPIKWQGVSLPLDRQSYSRRLLRFNMCGLYYTPHKVISYSTGQVSDSIPRMLNLAESCVFDKQSLLPALCPCGNNYYCTRPLFPKLRSHFAEFLRHYYPEHLSILYQSTCVQFRVRPVIHTIPMCLSMTSISCMHARHICQSCECIYALTHGLCHPGWLWA